MCVYYYIHIIIIIIILYYYYIQYYIRIIIIIDFSGMLCFDLALVTRIDENVFDETKKKKFYVVGTKASQTHLLKNLYTKNN